jgi:hypothetical protein
MITVVACGKLDIDGFKISPDVPVKVIDVKLDAPWNAPILVTLDGMVIDVKPDAPKNASAPILVTLDGMIIDVKPVSMNALFPILLRVDVPAKVIDVKPVVL